MSIAYFDCFSGISGDMCLGALVDAGVPLDYLRENLKKVPVTGYRITEEKVTRCGLAATKIDVLVGRSCRPLRYSDVRNIINKSKLSASVKKKGLDVFKILFDAESRVHGKSRYKIHLHELSGTDCFVDIFGTLLSLQLLGVSTVYASPLNLGGGTVHASHGLLPVPAPATGEIVKNIPVYNTGVLHELTTPTGAALIKSLAQGFGSIPPAVFNKVGVGAGGTNIANMPNVLRIFLGDTLRDYPAETITVIETNIDDMNPQLYGYLMEKLYREGALDVFLTQILMKKSRPGIKLSVLCGSEQKNTLIELILRETTTIGIRYYETSRVTMQRRFAYVQTKYGPVRVKISSAGRSVARSVPEFDDCRKLAEANDVPLLEIIEQASRAALKREKPPK